jgi:hypothetical protein
MPHGKRLIFWPLVDCLYLLGFGICSLRCMSHVQEKIMNCFLKKLYINTFSTLLDLKQNIYTQQCYDMCLCTHVKN